MNIMAKLITVLRGTAHESAEQIVDANCLRICEQEIRDCETIVHQVKHDLCHVMAETIKLKKDSTSLEKIISLKEEQAVEAFRKGEDELAHAQVKFIAQKEQLLKDLQEKHTDLSAYENKLKQYLDTAVRQIIDHRRELRVVQATASAQIASRAMSENLLTNSNVDNVTAILGRIKQKQRDVSSYIEATEQLNSELSGQALNERLKVAGILVPNGHSSEILQRIRAKADIKPN